MRKGRQKSPEKLSSSISFGRTETENKAKRLIVKGAGESVHTNVIPIYGFAFPSAFSLLFYLFFLCGKCLSYEFPLRSQGCLCCTENTFLRYGADVEQIGAERCQKVKGF